MVDPIIQARGTVLTPAIETHILQKVSRLSNFLQKANKVEVIIDDNLAHRKNNHWKVEFNIDLPTGLINIKETGTDLYALIDSMYNTLKVKLERAKDKSTNHHGNNNDIDMLDDSTYEVDQVVTDNVVDYVPEIAKRKVYDDDTPILPQAAIELMELIGHNCYLFKNAENNKYAMVYKIIEGKYGLVEPPQ